MSTREHVFEHDGHAFVAKEEIRRGDAEPIYKWCVQMDGRDVLDFEGPFNFRDEGVKRRIVEWYTLQKPVSTT